MLNTSFQRSIRKLFGQVPVAVGLTAITIGSGASPVQEQTEIGFWNFSNAAAIGPPAQAYAQKLSTVSATTLGGANAVRFRKLSPTPDIPESFNNDIVAAVAAGSDAGGFDAAHVPAVSINSAWGFIYTSGVPFGPVFDEFMGFLYGNSVEQGRRSGLALLQHVLDKRERNVVVIPIVGGSEQGSGYFMEPIGDTDTGKCRHSRESRAGYAGCRNTVKQDGIGLVGLCQRAWVLRYLPPAQNVLDMACDTLLERGLIREKNIRFATAVPGAQVFEQMIAGNIQGFEVATPVDDVSVLFSDPAGNPGTVGARFLHFPGWHQPFLVTYMLINKTLWNTLSEAQRTLIASVGRDHVMASYSESLRQQGDSLREILNANTGDRNPYNDVVLATWNNRDLKLLRKMALEFINDRRNDTTLSRADREDYVEILEALRHYVQRNNIYWERRSVAVDNRFTGGADNARRQGRN